METDFDTNILDKLDAGFQGHYEGSGERWGLGVDFTYLKLKDERQADITTMTKATLTDLFGFYRVINNFHVLAGARLADLNIKLTNPGQADAEGDRSLADVYAGGRLILPLSDSWSASLRGDVGAGDSDLVWNAVAVLNWDITRSIAMRGGYRWLNYELEKENDPLESKLDMRLEGPFMGVGFRW